MRIQAANDLGRLIRDVRQRRGLGQQQLANQAGVSRQWIVEIEKGKPRAPLELLLRTLRVLGLALLVEDDAMPHRRPIAPELAEVDLDEVVERARRKGP
jgi:HTH-type transcriptional regulator/antitoxin HipB